MSTQTNRRPAPAAVKRPCSPRATAATAAGSATMVTTTSDPAATSTGEAFTTAPLRPSSSARAGVRFHTAT